MSARGHARPTILMLGSESAFSGITLKRLLDAGSSICGFVIHESMAPARAFESLGDRIPVVVGGTGPAVAVEGGVPVIRLASMHDQAALERAASLSPDILLVACFPMILGREWLAMPREICLNLHPSVLPSYRGPTPLFWQFRAGEEETGITLHVIEEDVDAGDIVAQSTMPLPIGARFSDVNGELAGRGADLVIELLGKMSAGIAVPRTDQDEAIASYQPFPQEKDFRFDTHFTAERAFRFMRGTQEWGVPFEVDAGGTLLALESVLEYHDDARMAVPFEVDGENLWIRFSDGVLGAVGRLVHRG